MSDPKNKWNQPEAPPPPMFFGKKERDLVKQVNDELSERVIGQPIAYYAVDLADTHFNPTYGEAIDKVTLPAVRVFAYVIVDSEQTNERFGYEYINNLTVNFSEKRARCDNRFKVAFLLCVLTVLLCAGRVINHDRREVCHHTTKYG